jgi:carboxyl-terminal processing protease
MPVYFRLSLSKAIIFILLFRTNACFSQSFDKAASDAWTITRLAEKFHIQPKSLNDTFSTDFFDQFLKQLDPEHVFFNKKDIEQLDTYRLRLDDQVKQKRTDFLELITALYTKRLQQADTMIDAIAQKPFDFSSQEKFTFAEDTAYPVNAASMHNKLYKKMKLAVLSDLLAWNDEYTAENKGLPNQIPDSMQAVVQKHAQSVYKRDIKRILQSPGGIKQFISDAYCKALASCYDPHTTFFPLTEKENFESELGNVRFSFGFSIMEDPHSGVVINGLEPGSPAFKCGLLNKGDKFLTLQWQGQKAIDVSDADITELAAILSQSNHDKLIITVKKPDGSQRTVALVKNQAGADEDNKVKSFLLKGNKTMGYISLPAFYNNWENENEGDNGCANDVAREILKLNKDHISGLIIDLRYNGGGSIREAVELAGIFIDAGPVAQIKARMYSKILTLKDVNRGMAYGGPLIVLVNGYSASASELVAGSLQDYHRALIVGASTYGKATGQVILPLDTTVDLNSYDGSRQADDYLKITTSMLYRVTGATAQLMGVKPDIALPDLPEAHSHKEADEPFALPTSHIAPNQYYKPYAALPLNTLQHMAKQDADTIRYFIQLRNYMRTDGSEAGAAEISLNWEKALAKEKAALYSKSDTVTFTAGYSVQNNTYDLGNLKTDASSDNINSAFIHYLQHDPYVKICYDLLGAMAK